MNLSYLARDTSHLDERGRNAVTESRELIENSPYLETFKAKGQEVLLLSDPVDEFWTAALPEYKALDARTLNNLALVARERGHYKEAADFYQRSLSIWKAARGDGHPVVARTLCGLGTIQYTLGALDEADRLDAAFRATGPTGPLHCIPVLVKDQVETSDMPTTYGSVLFKQFTPRRDATVVKKLKAAGAIVIGKTNMGEFARKYLEKKL